MGKPSTATRSVSKPLTAATPIPVITSTNFAILVKKSKKARFAIQASNFDSTSDVKTSSVSWTVVKRKLDLVKGVMLVRATFTGVIPASSGGSGDITVTVTNTDSGMTQESAPVTVPVITDP